MLQVALRGGIEAEEVVGRAAARREEVERTQGEVLRLVGDDFGEAFVEKSLGTLRSLSQSTDDAEIATREWAARASEVQKERRETASAASTLKELSEQLSALAELGEILQESDVMEAEEDIAVVEELFNLINDAGRLCKGRGARIFQQIYVELQHRRDDALLMMQNRLLESINLTSSALEVRRCSPMIADALHRTNTFEETITELIRQVSESDDILWAIRKADVFAVAEDGDESDSIWTIEWSQHRTYAYDFPASIQLEENPLETELPEELLSVQDIANVAFRVDVLCGVLMTQLFGTRDSEYANYLRGLVWDWLARDLFQPPLILASDGASTSSIVSTTSLPKRCVAAFYLSKVLPEIVGVGDVEVVFGDSAAVLKMVARELRAELLFRARKSVSNFVLDDEDHVLLAPLASPWRPKERRNSNWFPSCLVTRTSLHIMEVVKQACADAATASQDGGEDQVLPETLLSTAIEALEAYRVDIPILHQTAFQGSLKLRCLYHNDCFMLSHVFGNIRSTSRLVPTSMKLRSSGSEVLLDAIADEKQRLYQSIEISSFGDGSLTHYGTPRVRKQCDLELTRMFAHNQEVCRVYAAMLPAGAAGNAIASLCAEFLNALTGSILALSEIAAEACDGLAFLLAGTVANCERLATPDRLREADPDAAKGYQTAVKRVHVFQEILNIRMEDIADHAKQGKYKGLLDKEEVEKLILAIFEDSALRVQMIQELHEDAQDEDWGW
ncbi:hypothetical protein NDN08_003190 [Rhodosorus marinus]|uniref:Exocyst complex component Sec8 n=1 Tax=Rhodosorus marinus TaxID=101924 RepID=A0AAV8V1N2_9RHOD|nr:hypothetical protein NDN08_003190 [Rhodosorus marinus]